MRLNRQNSRLTFRPRQRGGIEHGAPVAPDQVLHRRGEGGVTDEIRQVHDLPVEERSQSPVPPPVVGHEPHQGAEAYAC